MKSKTRITSIGIAVLAICALCLSAAGGAKKQVPRDFVISGKVFCQVTDMTGLPTIAFKILRADGVATHTGRYALEGDGSLDLSSGLGHDSGIFIAANGDEINWDGYLSNVDPVAGTGVLEVVIKSGNPGTGRFADCKGGFVAHMFDIQLDPISGAMSFSFAGRGELTY